MQFILPVAIGEAQIVSTTAVEDSLPAWNAATNWATGAQVLRGTRYEIYERLAPGGVDAAAPETDATKWSLVGASNSRRMFDQRVGSATTAPGSLTVVLSPGVATGALALLDLDCDSVTVQVATAAYGVIYTHTAQAQASIDPVMSWSDWTFNAIERRRLLVLTDLPPYAEATITITIAGSGTVSVGTLAMGPLYQLGDTAYSPNVGVTDYSVKTKDAWGVYSIVDRGYSSKATLQIEYPTGSFDAINARLKKARAKACVWIGSPDYAALVLYGICADWYQVLPGPAKSTGQLEIDGFV